MSNSPRTQSANGLTKKERSATCAPRDLHFEDASHKYAKAQNRVTTFRYTWWNFLPVNLFEQFQRVANFYFLIIMCLSLIPGLSPTTPITSILPLVFVIGVTAMKQGYEDYNRHVADRLINKGSTKIIIENGHETTIFTEDIVVGDLIRVDEDEEFPCDMFLLSSSAANGECYVTTANLDGETNLKIKSCLPSFAAMSPARLFEAKIGVVFMEPSPDLYHFSAYARLPTKPDQAHHADIHQLLLKGSRLRKTDHVYGVALYVGTETKIVMNQKKVKYKRSSVEKRLNVYLMWCFVWLAIESLLSTLLGASYYYHIAKKIPYLNFGEDSTGYGESALRNFVSFVLLYTYVIPISLYVTLELQKFLNAKWIAWDVEMWHDLTQAMPDVRNSDIIEELGQVQHVFADKTGTLTENEMVFKCGSVGGVLFDFDGAAPDTHKVLLRDAEASENITEGLEQYFIALAVCNTVSVDYVPEAHDGGLRKRMRYVSVSPDEEALCAAAAMYGVELVVRTQSSLELSLHSTVSAQIKLLHTIEFNSDRMRMSVLTLLPTGEMVLFCKGADSAVLPLVTRRPRSDPSLSLTHYHLNVFSNRGFRTLVVARRVFGPSEASSIAQQLKAALETVSKRETLLLALYQRLECDLELLGVTAVEDRLQDGVASTMELLRGAGMRVWVLTGDKVETAVNISYAARHISPHMQLHYACGLHTEAECQESLLNILNSINSGEATKKEEVVRGIGQQRRGSLSTFSQGMGGAPQHTLVADGPSVAAMLTHCPLLFHSAASACHAVLCCRLSPMQKALIVRLVKSTPDENSGLKPITLAVGDGANDVAMIREAHVGVAILGKEGRQAARSSDYSFGRFRFLSRLLLVHGHYAYLRIANSVQYFFYKNLVFTLPLLLFGFASCFSVQTPYDSWLLVFWNICFTSLPIFFYGLFERDLDPSQLIEVPQYYSSFAHNALLAPHLILAWLAAAMWHGVVIFVSVYSFEPSEGLGLWAFGTMMYTLSVLIVTLKLALFTHSWTSLTHFAMWGTLIFYVCFLFVYCGVDEVFGSMATNAGMFWVIFQILGRAENWFLFLGASVLALFPDFLERSIRFVFLPDARQAVLRTQWLASLNPPPPQRSVRRDERTPLLRSRTASSRSSELFSQKLT